MGISEGLCYLPYRHSLGSLEYRPSIFFLGFCGNNSFQVKLTGIFAFKHFFHCNLVEILAGIFKLECSPLAVVYSNSDS